MRRFVCWSPNHCEEAETPLVWPYLKILWHDEDSSAGDNEKSKKDRIKKSRWEDSIKEWTRMGFGDSLRAAEDNERWKRHLWCPEIKWFKHGWPGSSVGSELRFQNSYVQTSVSVHWNPTGGKIYIYMFLLIWLLPVGHGGFTGHEPVYRTRYMS